jgi:molybdopterin molybdotransferase
VDGYALGSTDRETFHLTGEVAAGGAPTAPLAPDQAAAVMTGALVPEGTVAVEMLEKVEVASDQLRLAGPVAAGQLVNAAGSEARAGDPLLAAGAVLTPTVHAAVLTAGLAELRVFRRPRVGILVTGDEVHAPGEAAPPGAVFETNGPLLASVAAALGGEVLGRERVGDDPAATAAALERLAAASDLVLTSGGVSRGRYDHVGKLLRAAPERLLLAGTAIKPGRPLHAARAADGTPVLALPGYPASLLTNLFLYGVPALRRLAGRRAVATRWLRATLATPLRYRPGRFELARVALELVDGRWEARDPGSQQSSHFLNFTAAAGLAALSQAAPPGHPGGPAHLEPGTEVRVLHFGLELS